VGGLQGGMEPLKRKGGKAGGAQHGLRRSLSSYVSFGLWRCDRKEVKTQCQGPKKGTRP